MATIYIDNSPYQVPDGQNLLHACLSLGFDLPYFCWHPAMHSVGACRQCAVKQFKDEHDTRGRIIMACMTLAADGIRISIDDPDARAFRAGVIELLMVNHPHDCPVCDEGGECHLQDMTVMTGHTHRRFRFKKRTHRNQDIGPFVNHEMNRCIQCYRCVRFYRDYAGGRDFHVFGWHDDVYFGRHADGTLQLEFSGNLVEVCPTGVFTDKTLKAHYTRKWDLQTAPSVCVHCGLGCNTIPGERYGTLRRIRNRYNHDVNGYFLCDRGRYGYEFVESDRRIRRIVLRDKSPEGATPAEEALRRAAVWLAAPGRTVGIGSPRASLEANFALRSLVGAERFCLGMSDREQRLAALALEILRTGPARSPSLREVEASDAVLVLGEDVTNTAPRLALALRQSVLQKPLEIARSLRICDWDDAALREAMQRDRGPLFIATPDEGKLDDAATRTYRAAPDDIARLGFEVARALVPDTPAVPDLPDDVGALAGEIAKALRAAERPLVVSGTGCASEAVMRAAAGVARALCATGKPAALCLTMPEPNSMGLALMGGGSLADAAAALREGAADTLIILENDLYRRADAATVDALLASAKHVIVLDYLATATAAKADAVFPAATFAEGDGTFVSSEGRAQRFYKVMAPAGDVRDSWRWLRDLAAGSDPICVPPGAPGLRHAWPNLDAIDAALAEALPVFRPILDIAPVAAATQRIPRQPPRYSGRTAMHANLSVQEPQPPDDPDSPLAFSMEGSGSGAFSVGSDAFFGCSKKGSDPFSIPTRGSDPFSQRREKASDPPEYWSPGWNSVQALNKFQQEVGGPLAGGEVGRRLIEPLGSGAFSGRSEATKGSDPFSQRREKASDPADGRLMAVPLHHIFGSEELSILSPGIASLVPQPYVALHPEDAARLGVGEGDEVHVIFERGGQSCPPHTPPPSGAVTRDAHRVRLPVRLRPGLARGVAGVPVGLPGFIVTELPAWVEIARADMGTRTEGR